MNKTEMLEASEAAVAESLFELPPDFTPDEHHEALRRINPDVQMH